MQYIIENVEEEIEQWCKLEYKHITETVDPSKTIFTRIPKHQVKELESEVKGRMLTDSLESLKELDWSRALLLDMDATEELKVEDAEKFDVVIVGGILGNVPSDDLTRSVRSSFSLRHFRNLGSQQMTTNTALLVAKIILEDKVPLSQIPFIDDPEISSSENSKESICLPFRYVARSYFTKDEKDRNTPILPEGLLNFLSESADSSLV